MQLLQSVATARARFWRRKQHSQLSAWVKTSSGVFLRSSASSSSSSSSSSSPLLLPTATTAVASQWAAAGRPEKVLRVLAYGAQITRRPALQVIYALLSNVFHARGQNIYILLPLVTYSKRHKFCR